MTILLLLPLPARISAFAVMLVASCIIWTLAFIVISALLKNNCVPPIHDVRSSNAANETISATRPVFTGHKIRSFPFTRKFSRNDNDHLQAPLHNVDETKYRFPKFEDIAPCTSWAIVTTVYAPTESVKVAARLPSDTWCLVIVGDDTTPENYLDNLLLDIGQSVKDHVKKQRNIFFLSANDQRRLYQNHPFVKRLPFKSFARKNVGFLFAIQNGAHVIFDFDDENVLYSFSTPKIGTVVPIEPYGWSGHGDPQVPDHMFVRYFADANNSNVAPLSGQVLNPYSLLHPMNPNGEPLLEVWPRGYPLEQLEGKHQFVAGLDGIFFVNKSIQIGHGRLATQHIGVIQYVCDEYPDVDAVYRLTRKLPLKFDRDQVSALKILIPPRSYAPYNAHATLHLYHSFFALLLPLTVPERVADIWRAYFAQRLFHDLGIAVVYAPPVVRRVQSPHKNLSSMLAEADLYHKTEKLVDFLENKWTWTSNNQQGSGHHDFPARMEDLWISLYEHDYIGLADVEAIQEWLLTLLAMGYEFPVVPDSTANNSFLVPKLEPLPMFKGQPYWKGTVPLHLGGPSGQETYDTFLQRRGGVATSDLWHEWLRGVENNQHHVGQVKKNVRLIMMTMNEWPLIVQWTVYHGSMLGYENLYIMDSSTDKRCIEFLVHARDQWGANVIFTNANLNEVIHEINVIAKSFAPYTDFMAKVDTDEFLVAQNRNANRTCFVQARNLRTLPNCELTPYEVETHLYRLVPTLEGRRMRFGSQTRSEFDRELCVSGSGNQLGKFKFPPPFLKETYKVILDARTFTNFDLGGHRGESLSGYHEKFPDAFTELGMLHMHSRCIEEEVENNRKALIRHNYISEHDSPEVSLQKAIRICGPNVCDVDTPCPVVSGMKMRNHAQYIACPEQFISRRYDVTRNDSLVNPDFQKYLDDAMKKYGAFRFLNL